MSELITLALYVLATARLLRLVMDDKITDPIREWIIRSTPKQSLRRYFITCAWCVSIWVAAAPAFLYVLIPDNTAARIPAAILAFSAAAVFLRDLWQLAAAKAALYSQPMAAAPEQQPEEEAHR
jgi:hypothetical protein